jgi:hypothetical protein
MVTERGKARMRSSVVEKRDNKDHYSFRSRYSHGDYR